MAVLSAKIGSTGEEQVIHELVESGMLAGQPEKDLQLVIEYVMSTSGKTFKRKRRCL